jgi:hypothetical protein
MQDVILAAPAWPLTGLSFLTWNPLRWWTRAKP